MLRANLEPVIKEKRKELSRPFRDYLKERKRQA